MLDAREIIIQPIISEKSYNEIEKNKYTFKVHPKANKIEISQAVKELFNVQVIKVNTIWVKSKPKSLGKWSGKSSSWKKAVVTLKPGDKIEFFEGA